MALEDIPTAIAAAFEALPGTRTRYATSDYRTDLEAIAEGETKYQLRTLVVARDNSNSNASWSRMGVQIQVVHRLAASSGIYPDATYTRTVMLADTRSLADRSWWSAIAGVQSLSEIEIESERVGHSIVYTVTAELVVIF